MINNNDDIIYLVAIQNVQTCNGVLYQGVSFPDWKCLETNMYCITYEDKEYIVPICCFIPTRSLTRLENISAADYRYKQRADDTQDYVKAMAQVGIDLKANYSPQFRDGFNPHKKNINAGENNT